jgi:cytochrome c-type biogenesis protein CcmE
MKLDAAATVSVEAVLKDPAAFDGKELRLTGMVNKVCVPKGCWMQFDSPGSQMPIFVKFTCPVNGRLIPLEAVGKEAVVEGKLEIVEISEAAAKHYLEDEGAKPEEIAKIVGPQKQLRVKGPSAMVKN